MKTDLNDLIQQVKGCAWADVASDVIADDVANHYPVVCWDTDKLTALLAGALEEGERAREALKTLENGSVEYKGVRIYALLHAGFSACHGEPGQHVHRFNHMHQALSYADSLAAEQPNSGEGR